MEKDYFSTRGDIVWLNFNPQSGLALFYTITSKVKGYPLEVEINQEKIKGAVLSDQVRNLDWKVRKIEFIQKIEAEKLEEVIRVFNRLSSYHYLFISGRLTPTSPIC